MPCPLCILGFTEPHTKADWEKLRNEDLQRKLREIRQPIIDFQHKHFEETGEIICGWWKMNQNGILALGANEMVP